MLRGTKTIITVILGEKYSTIFISNFLRPNYTLPESAFPIFYALIIVAKKRKDYTTLRQVVQAAGFVSPLTHGSHGSFSGV